MTKKRQKRIFLIIILLCGVGLASYLAIKAFEENLLYFMSPKDIYAGKVIKNKNFRLGGIVKNDSVKREGLNVWFDLTDYEKTIKVHYKGILPDLFREGQGIIATGFLENNIFKASEVLAKHDENYMPPEVAASLKK